MIPRKTEPYKVFWKERFLNIREIVLLPKTMCTKINPNPFPVLMNTTEHSTCVALEGENIRKKMYCYFIVRKSFMWICNCILIHTFA
ncbi:hypothetical protein X975_03712, partial [Stegodyphus mimosarum]